MTTIHLPRQRCDAIYGKLCVIICAFVLAGCVNDGGTGALTSTQIQSANLNDEQTHIAKQCNSANRLKSSNMASAALNNKYTAYSNIETSLAPERKSEIVSELQSQGASLGTLDSNLNTLCNTWSKCEYLALTVQQNCAGSKHKFLAAEKQMVNFATRVNKIKIN